MLLYPLFNSLFGHINFSYRIKAFFSSASILKTDEDVYYLHLRQRLDLLSLAIQFSGCSNQAGPVRHSILLISSMLIALVLKCWIVDTAQVLPLWNINCIQYRSYSIGSKQLFFTMKVLHPLQNWNCAWSRTATNYLEFVFFDNMVFQPHCHDRRLQFQSWY